MTKKRNICIRDHLNDNSLDLSLCDLQDVPVKAIASVPKVTDVDLSSNKLAVLGCDFAPSLAHLVKLDLSGNHLSQLPDNFGLLVNLKHLDLYKNQLEILPPSFAELRSLRWLDLKENPLTARLSQVVGNCLDQSQCVAAARNVIKYLSQVQREAEEEAHRTEQLRLQKLLEDEQKLAKKELKQKRRKIRKMETKNAERLKDGAIGVAVPEKPVDFELHRILEQQASLYCRVQLAGRKIIAWLVLLTVLVGLVAYLRGTEGLARGLDALPLHFVLSTAAAVALTISGVASSALFLLLHAGQFLVDCSRLLTASEYAAVNLNDVRTQLELWLVKTSDLIIDYSQQLAALIKNYFR